MAVSEKLMKKREKDCFDAGFEAGLGLKSHCNELVRILQVALDQTGCDGDLCAYAWHEDARTVLAAIKNGD